MGMLIEWDDQLNLGISEIDAQHQKLVVLINELHEAMLARRTNEVLGTIIERLLAYTKSHFRTEELYFAEFAFPEKAAHTEAHQRFTGKVLDFQRDFSEGKLLLSMEVMTFLKEWLIQHILGTDRKYVALFRERGLG